MSGSGMQSELLSRVEAIRSPQSHTAMESGEGQKGRGLKRVELPPKTLDTPGEGYIMKRAVLVRGVWNWKT